MKTALIISHHQHLCENMSEFFELEGLKSLVAESSVTGLQQAMLYHPDVIICEMKMPETNGILFQHLIKEERTTQDIPLIFFSSSPVPNDFLKKLEQDGDIFLSNPFTCEQLMIAIGSCLNKVSTMG